MNTRVRLIMAILVVLVLLGVTAGPAAAYTKTDITAYECCEVSEYAGKEFFPDGRYHIRGGISSFNFWSDDPRLDNATNRITLNANFVWMPEPIYAAGNMWGTFVITNDGGWVGRHLDWGKGKERVLLLPLCGSWWRRIRGPATSHSR